MHRLIITLALILLPLPICAENIIEYRCSDDNYQSSFTVDKSGVVSIHEYCFYDDPWCIKSNSYKLLDFELLVLLGNLDEIAKGILEIKEISRQQVGCLGELKVKSSHGEFIVKLVHINEKSESGVVASNDSPASTKILNWIFGKVGQKISG